METALERMKEMVLELQKMSAEGKSLTEIMNFTYEQRESGADWVYFGVGQRSKNPEEEYLLPRPLVRQKAYKALLDQIAPGLTVISKYWIEIGINGRVTFEEKEYFKEERRLAKKSVFGEKKPESIKEQQIRRTIKVALENMYMLGGNPRPEPKYDSYLNNMIECVMHEVEKLTTNHEITK